MLAVGTAMAMSFTSCSDFTEVTPAGVISDVQAYNAPDSLVNAAYAGLGDDWFTYPFNLWPYGNVASDDAYKGGGEAGDVGGYHHFEVWNSLTSTPGEMDELWYRFYCQISRCNRALIALEANGDKLGANVKKQRIAEMKFLRANHYFKLIQVFRKVAWIDEDVVRNMSHEQTRNDVLSYEELMGKVIKDFTDAYNDLPEANPGTTGRAHKVAAAAYLAKTYLTLAYGDGYESTNGVGKGAHWQEYLQKVDTLTAVVENSKYNYLEDYGDIFLPEFKNSKESIFAVQHSDKNDDHTTFGRANWSTMLNGCPGIWSYGHDFHKPTQNLVNAFKTKDGLPMKDFDKDHNALVKRGEFKGQKYDPRLFHTVGMPTWPYKYEEEYTLSTEKNKRNPGMYGFYTSLKEVPQRSKGETYDNPWQAFAMNDYILRYTDVMLMRAEALLELGKDGEALIIVNKIRSRAKNSVEKHIAYAKEFCEIEEYAPGAFKDKEFGREAIRFERRVELAMEGHRFFDLRRWGIASQVLKDFFAGESKSEYDGQKYGDHYGSARFTPEKNEFWPVPFNQLHYVPGLYTQNKGYDN